ncbi:hypothetical protein [uncultured Campylobacter sp.]|uniref:hypothetical protein n=1 Tax=uncultured Campylobacter sp. TaxID=218934 RepID=UPI002612986C|nr:hypothetical protein [uncultured Campylobacter sp.]
MATDYYEVKPLPQRCIDCEEAAEGEKMGVGIDAYCYNCDYALDRFHPIKDTELAARCRKCYEESEGNTPCATCIYGEVKERLDIRKHLTKFINK